MIPFSFEELQKILEFNADEIDTDILIFNATLSFVEKNLGFNIEDKNYNELKTIRDCKVYTEQDHITEMVNIIDMNTKEHIPNCVIDGRTIYFIDPKLEGHVVFLNYNAGYTADTLPSDLKEAIIKLYLLKKKEFIIHKNNDDETSFEMPQNIQSVIDLYRRKTL